MNSQRKRRCFGRTKSLHRCNRTLRSRFFCQDHRTQPLCWTLLSLGLLSSLLTILSSVSPERTDTRTALPPVNPHELPSDQQEILPNSINIILYGGSPLTVHDVSAVSINRSYIDALKKFMDRRPEEALEKLDNALRLEPTNTQLLSAKGIILEHIVRHKEAIDQLRSSLNLNRELFLTDATRAQTSNGVGR